MNTTPNPKEAEREALLAVMWDARREHNRKSSDRIVNCHPNIKGWDREAWNRDYPEVGGEMDYIADAVLAARRLSESEIRRDEADIRNV